MDIEISIFTKHLQYIYLYCLDQTTLNSVSFFLGDNFK